MCAVEDRLDYDDLIWLAHTRFVETRVSRAARNVFVYLSRPELVELVPTCTSPVDCLLGSDWLLVRGGLYVSGSVLAEVCW